MKNCLLKYREEIAASLFVYLGIFLFFTKAHPFVMFDGDDWGLISISHAIYPQINAWNPSKVLPEVLYPLFGYISAYIVTPFTGDYVYSFTLTAAVIVATAITIYVFMMIVFIEKAFSLEKFPAIFLGLIVIISHFYMFNIKDRIDNDHLFLVPDLCCLFYYLIPSLLCMFLMLFFAINNTQKIVRENNAKSAALIFVAYFAIVSNILCCSVLMCYVVTDLLFGMKKDNLTRQGFIKYAKENWFYVTMIVVWLVSLYCEAHGGRASMVEDVINKSSIIEGIKNTAILYYDVLFHNNNGKFFVCFMLLTLPFIWRKRKSEEHAALLWRWIKKVSFCIPMWLVYTILIASKAGAWYGTRKDVLIGLFCYLFIILMAMASFWIKKFTYTKLVLPLIAFALFSSTYNGNSNFKPNLPVINEFVELEVSRYLVNTIVEADKSGVDELKLPVPKGNDFDNWPIPLYAGERMVRTLYLHGIISRRFKVEYIADPELNQKFNLPVNK